MGNSSGFWMRRLTRVVRLTLCCGCLVVVAATQAEERPVRIGLTPVIVEDQVRVLNQWRAFLEEALGRDVEFLRRYNYGEVVQLALRGQVDFAWVCGYLYVNHHDVLDLLAAPVFNGSPRYQSYLIVPVADTSTRGLADLAGGIFAFSDPSSNSGWLYPEALLRRNGTRAEQHFQRTFYTWGHRRVVEAVAHGLADGGAVDGYIWETLARMEPALTEGTRIVNRSDAFGFPPIVATPAASPELRRAMLDALLAMDRSGRGREVLGNLNLDGFTVVDSSLYESIRALTREVLE